MVSLINRLPQVRGRLTEQANIAVNTWFRVGGAAEILFKPEDEKDLSDFLAGCPSDVSVITLGVCSNLIIRDGGIKGVVIRLGREFAEIDHDKNTGIITVGAAALDMNVAQYAARHGLGGIEFLSGIPGTIGGALRMNAGAYLRETVDILIDCKAMDRDGSIHVFKAADMHITYRHNGLPDHFIFLSARFKTVPENSELIQSRIDEIRVKRHDSQPVKAQTGGSTFANPSIEDLRKAGLSEDTKTWQLIDAIGGRGLKIGGAVMSEKHCNFMINEGHATAQDLEDLGEEIRRRVEEKFGIMLRWEIKRIGEKLSFAPIASLKAQGSA
jgi:UDP-N-acetylmuramate dehydrogenase